MEHTAHAPTQMLGTRVISFIVSGWRRYQHRHRSRSTMRILQRLSDHTLKDIGIDRSEILLILYGGGANRLRSKQAMPLTVKKQPRQKERAVVADCSVLTIQHNYQHS